jgi:lipoyl-dependent peroxiredoxin
VARLLEAVAGTRRALVSKKPHDNPRVESRCVESTAEVLVVLGQVSFEEEYVYNRAKCPCHLERRPGQGKRGARHLERCSARGIVDLASRTNRSQGMTSPEELIAAAHSGCYAMALSHTLAERGTPAQRLDVDATASFDSDKLSVSAVRLEVTGEVPGIDQAGLEDAAQQAERACPVSNALRGNVAIDLSVSLS